LFYCGERTSNSKITATTAFTNPLTRKNERIAGLKNEWKLHLLALVIRTRFLRATAFGDFDNGM
jgi:hypothetical protein